MEGHVFIANEAFTRRTVAITGWKPESQNGGLSVAVGSCIYYFGGRSAEDTCGQILVFNTTTSTWSKISTNPPQKYGDSSLYGTAIGTNIWIYDQASWMCFDTVGKEWRNFVLKAAGSPNWSTTCLYSFGIIGQSTICYYDGDSHLFDKKVYQLNTETNQIFTPDLEGFGDHPQERHAIYMTALSDEILMLYASCSEYNMFVDKSLGELFYYDLKQGKWAGVKKSAQSKPDNLYRYQYCGRIGQSLVFVPNRQISPNEWLSLNLATATWEKIFVRGDSDFNLQNNALPLANYSTIVGDKIYCWMTDGQMHVVDVPNMPDQIQLKEINEQMARVAREELDKIKPPVAVIDEFVPDPIVIDFELENVKEKLTVHKEIATQFDRIFPLIEKEKIIDSTVPEPSHNVLLHKNYIHYLTLAWSNHFSVVLSPDIIFYTVLCEIADEITTNPETFRHLFTDSLDKKPIMSFTHEVGQINLESLIQGIAKNVPVDASIFTANFSSSTVESRLAMQAAFCEAMSAYFFYMSSACGIPRIKILGTKQDWRTLEHKIHRMRTEIFNQDGTTDQTMCEYLTRAEQQVRKIYTTRDPMFWKEMFSIGRCRSGHTDVVEGWINQFYRIGHAQKKSGKVTYSGDDFYNYKAHISTVNWKNVETQRNFTLKTGLLYSNVVRGNNIEDTKFPWLEPQFSHVIVESDGKMSPDGFKKYIEGTLRGNDRKLMRAFYKILKDDPMELVKTSPKLVDFRFELVERQMDAWKTKFLKKEKTVTDFDLDKGPCQLALSFYDEISKENQPALDSLKNKISEYLQTNTTLRRISMNNQISDIEPYVIECITGMPNIEDLVVSQATNESIEKVSQLLLDPNCKLKRLEINFTPYLHRKQQHEPSFAPLALALSLSDAPLESLVFDRISIDAELANAIEGLCKRLKYLKYTTRSQVVQKRLMKAQAESKTLKEISIVDLGSADLVEFIASNVPLNPSLEVIRYHNCFMNTTQLANLLRIPTLKKVTCQNLQDLSFLGVTSKLSDLNASLTCSPEQIAWLRNFVLRDDCCLESLTGEKSSFEPGAGLVLAMGLVLNKSIRTLNLNKATFNGAEDAAKFAELMAEWLEKSYCKVENIDLSEVSNFFFAGKTLHKLLRALLNNSTVKKIAVSVTVTPEDLPLFVELVTKNSTMEHVEFSGNVQAELTREQRAPLKQAIKVNKTLVTFAVPLLPNNEHKSVRFNIDDFIN